MAFHVNNDGVVGRCEATIEECPFKDNPHAPTRLECEQLEEARLEAELSVLAQPIVAAPVSAQEAMDRLYEEVVPYRLKVEGKVQEALLKTAERERRPLSTHEMQSHSDYVEEVTSILRENGGETVFLLGGGDDNYSYERTKEQNKIKDHLEKELAKIPGNREMLIAGGMAGAGKTTAVYEFGIADPDQYFSVNTDDTKELMAKAGMVPKIPGLLPMEASTLIHEEASDLTKFILRKAMREGKNVFLDTTLASLKTVIPNLKVARSKGYKIEGFFVNVSKETSLERGTYRYQTMTNQTLMTGEGIGGRPVPKHFVAEQDGGDGVSKNARNFLRLFKTRGLFTQTPRVFDNNGTAPREISPYELTKEK